MLGYVANLAQKAANLKTPYLILPSLLLIQMVLVKLTLEMIHLTWHMMMGKILKGIGDVTNYPLSVEPSDVSENFQFGCRLINNGGHDNFTNGAGVFGQLHLVECCWHQNECSINSFHLQRISGGLRNSYYLLESIYIALPTAFKQSMAKYPLVVA
ncbi:hypothetical protein ACH5RR_033922 [Cinchona calisaya]|uniref:Uncharacterized protein n=1 Tax=Cinchona calisaya TaxID=153742 RepID=A0ABD2Y9D8_9GENT